jgi:hypothetical protein
MKKRIERLEAKISPHEWKCAIVREIAPGVYVDFTHGYPVDVSKYDHLIVLQVVS